MAIHLYIVITWRKGSIISKEIPIRKTTTIVSDIHEQKKTYTPIPKEVYVFLHYK